MSAMPDLVELVNELGNAITITTWADDQGVHSRIVGPTSTMTSVLTVAEAEAYSASLARTLGAQLDNTAAASTPKPPTDTPGPGRVWVAVPARNWRVHTRDQLCRRQVSRRRCRRPAAADLNRPRYSQGVLVPSWWAYCDEHMYGRWVQDGQVLEWRVRRLNAVERAHA